MITEIEVKVKVYDKEKGEMREAVSATATLSKDESETREQSEENIYILIQPGSLPYYANAVISINSDHKPCNFQNNGHRK